MANMYICIGTMKTGTTAIQYFLAHNRRKLQEQGFCYPKMNVEGKRFNNRNAHFLIHQAEGETEEERSGQERRIREQAIEKLREVAKSYDSIILSEELIWHYSKKFKNFWANVKEDVERIGCKLKIVVYLRRQDELLESLWKQLVKHGTWDTPFDEFVHNKKYQYFILDYHDRINKIAKVVGKESIIVRPYEYGQFKGERKDVISDFIETLGIKADDEFVWPEAPMNPSLEGNYLELKRHINGVEEYCEMEENFLEKSIMQLVMEDARKANGSALFSMEERARLMAEFEEGNTKLAKNYLGQEKLFFKPLKNDPKFVPNQEEMLYGLVRLFTLEMCKMNQKVEELENLCKLEKMEKRIVSLEELQRLSVKQRIYNKYKRMRQEEGGWFWAKKKND